MCWPHRFAAKPSTTATHTATDSTWTSNPPRSHPTARRCVGLATALELPFCGIDLCHRPDDSWLCYEVNPSPGYSWYEEATGLPISDALVAWLASR